jgi:Ca2+/H+ antiporter
MNIQVTTLFKMTGNKSARDSLIFPREFTSFCRLSKSSELVNKIRARFLCNLYKITFFFDILSRTYYVIAMWRQTASQDSNFTSDEVTEQFNNQKNQQADFHTAPLFGCIYGRCSTMF